MAQWLVENWPIIAVPMLVFFAVLIIGLWLRRAASGYFDRWVARARWEGSSVVNQTLRRTSVYWFILLGAAIAVQVSSLPPQAKSLAGRLLGSLFVVSFGWVLITLSEWLLGYYLPKLKASQLAIRTTINVTRIIILILGILILLDTWGVPTAPLLLLIVVVALAAALVFRDTAPNLFAGFQLNTTQQIKVGDYIKVETGEEGYITEMSWANVRLKGLDQSSILVPNSRLLRSTFVNYGHPLKVAKEPFRFYSRTHLKELTGLKARNLQEMVSILKTAPDAVIYYHTHNFLEEHYYLTPEPSNDFAVWVSDALGDDALGEQLASIDTFSFSNLSSLRDRLVGIIEEHLARGCTSRDALEGREFHFVRSVSIVLPTHFVASDLREFTEALRKVSLSSLYFHIFESRLRLGRGLNDFSVWLRDSLEELDLADDIARVDPYTYTLGGLKTWLLQLMEKRIK
ncbi:MAG: mechanosensitive ion channel family protein [Chloroflexi bacterium]|nr:mechanosensitive ion channel family protein [Chloroflexota bacterium]